MKIFLSPSNQTANIGAYGNTNEHEQCQLIAEAAKAYLDKNYVCITQIAERSDDMKTRAAYANTTGVSVYVAIHTNACSNRLVSGTETFYHSSDNQGKLLSQALLESVGNITGVKRRVQARDSLVELNTPLCTKAYIEVEFHSNPEKAKWIKNNTMLLGETIGETIASFENISKKTEIPNEKWIFENIDFIFNTIVKKIKKEM